MVGFISGGIETRMEQLRTARSPKQQFYLMRLKRRSDHKDKRRKSGLRSKRYYTRWSPLAHHDVGTWMSKSVTRSTDNQTQFRKEFLGPNGYNASSVDFFFLPPAATFELKG